jgi:hypothetical protein
MTAAPFSCRMEEQEEEDKKVESFLFFGGNFVVGRQVLGHLDDVIKR